MVQLRIALEPGCRMPLLAGFCQKGRFSYITRLFTRRIPRSAVLLPTPCAQSFAAPQAERDAHKFKLLYRPNSACVKKYNTIYSVRLQDTGLYGTVIASAAHSVVERKDEVESRESQIRLAQAIPVRNRNLVAVVST